MLRVIIVGGGYAGATLATALDRNSRIEVTLVERRESFVHCVGAIRAVTQPELLDRIVIPFDRLLQRGTIIQGSVVDVSEGRVRLADGRIVEGDAVVTATGSSYAAPFKAGGSTEAFLEQSRTANASLKQARSVAIVGGGAVGVELAGEIANTFPAMAVTLIAASGQVMPGYASKLASALQQQLVAQGVTVKLGVQIEGMMRTDGPFAGPINAGGQAIEADLVFPALGAKAQLPPLAGAAATASGRVAVDQWLRPKGYARVFAVGDAAETGDPMTIVSITRQVPWLAKTLKAVARGARLEDLPAYSPWPMRAIVVPVGPSGGASVLPLGRNGLMVGRRPTSWIKGRDLFISKYSKDFGYGA